MSAPKVSQLPVQGQLADTGVADVLRRVESEGGTARVRFDTEVGFAEVEFAGGTIVGARMGELSGKTALYRLLGIVDGDFEINYGPVEQRAALASSVAQVLEDRSHRVVEWRKACEHAPPLSSMLSLSTAGREALDRRKLPREQLALLELCDGKRTISEIIDEARLDAVDALIAIAECHQSGLLTEAPAHGSSEPPPPAQQSESGPREVGGAGSPPVTGVNPPPVTGVKPPFGHDLPASGMKTLSLRRTTFVGIGSPDFGSTPPPAQPEPTPPPGRTGTDVRRIISIEPAPMRTASPIRQTLSAGTQLEPQPEPARAQEQQAEVEPIVSEREPALSERAILAHSQPSAPAAAGATEGKKYVGRYEVLCRIGRGGMGTVYLARLTSEGGFRRLFALKLLRSHLMKDSSTAQKFLEEARLAGHIHHPNVVSVVDAGLHGSQPYLVMEYVEGGSLKELLTAQMERRPAELILPIIIDALAGLSAAHTLVGEDGVPLGLVHCDVSPENMMVGVDGVCRLADFGVAKHAAHLRRRQDVTHGKPGYLSPEQVLGQRVDQRADIFAMGVVLYNALTGLRLFEAATVEETMQRVCNQRIEPPSTVGLQPPPSLDFLCMKALERQPDRRFGSAEEMMIELRRIALREQLLAPTTHVAAWVRDSVGRQLAQRKLAILDASRRPAQEGRPASQAPAAASAAAPVVSDPNAADPPKIQDSDPPVPGAPDADHLSRTIVLPAAAQHSRRALVIASVLAAIAVIATLMWPSKVSKLFRLNTEGVTVDDVRGKIRTTPLAPSAPGAAGTIAPSAGPAPAAVPTGSSPATATDPDPSARPLQR